MLFKKRKEGIDDENSLSERSYFPEIEQIRQALDAKNEATETYDLARMPLGRSRTPTLPEIPELPEEEAEEPEESKSREKELMPELPELPEEEGEMTIPEFPKKEGKKPKAPRKEEPELREKVTREKRPLFIKIDRFKEILASIGAIEQKVKIASDTIQRLKKIRDDESQIMENWESSVQELKAKLETIEKELTEIGE